MQTLLDKAIYHFTFIHEMEYVSFILFLGIMDFLEPLGWWTATVVTCSAYCLTFTFVFSALTIVVVRYSFSITHKHCWLKLLLILN